MPFNERVTIPEIAEQSGVSLSTVSLVLREWPGLSTMPVDKVGMGRLAMRLLSNRVEHANSSPV